MNLKCKINGKEYEILVQGNTLSDEYNETLDSGNIILAHIKKIKKLKPFDDVYIYDNEFNGYDRNGTVRGQNKFYKHLLVDNYTEEFINLRDKIYKYKIALMSEIKRMEKIQCPNISITQPLDFNKKVSVYEYITRYVELYSPKVKRVKNKDSKTWVYENKYKVDPSLETIFGNVYAPDFSLNAPTLRDILSKLMIVKDMIPYVENDIIKAIDITQRKNEINLENIPVTNIVATMRSNEYCDALRRNYSDSLSQDSTCRSIEYIGFRNSDNVLMTVDNMRLETRFPIYKINKITMCYFKKSIIAADENATMFLCKQDITPLVKLNTERNVLSQDWDDFKYNFPFSIEEMAQYKMCTVGYDIGSKYITGWGTRYTYPAGWWDITKTYIENIVNILDSIREYGTEENFRTLASELSKQGFKIEDMAFTPNGQFGDSTISPFSNDVLKFKSLLFIVDYQGFYNGSVIHSKDLGNDDIVSNDNSSSSLALLELDGLSQKEKVNRLGNKTYQFTVKYEKSEDLSMLLNLGDYFSYDEEDDIIIYHREIAIYDNYIIATYFAAKDYVLKNYYTSVYARHRTWNLISYGESVTRAENRKINLLLSKEKLLYESGNNFMNEVDNDLLLSCFKKSSYNEDLVLQKGNKIDMGYIVHALDSNFKYFLTDVNAFLSGYSLCFNISTFDNISMGNYIKKASPFSDKVIKVDGVNKNFEDLDVEFFTTKNDYTGSVQDWYSIVDDLNTGFTKTLGLYVGHNLTSNNFGKITTLNKEKVYDYYNNYFFKLPLIESRSINASNIMGNLFDIYKDNKEVINMTYQIEPISIDNDVLFSQWFMKLNDMLSNFGKRQETLMVGEEIPEEFIPTSQQSVIIPGFVFLSRTYLGSDYNHDYSDTLPFIVFGFESVGEVSFNKIKEEIEKNGRVLFYNGEQENLKIEFVVNNKEEDNPTMDLRTIYYYSFEPQKIVSINSNNIVIEGTQTIKINYATSVNVNTDNGGNIFRKENARITLKRKKVDDSDLGYSFYFVTLTEFDMAGSVAVTTNNTWVSDKDADFYEENWGWVIDRENETITSGKITKENNVIAVKNGVGFSNPYSSLEEYENKFNKILGWADNTLLDNYKRNDLSIILPEPIEEKPKNMFVFSSVNEMKNTLVYDEYPLNYFLNNNDFSLINNEENNVKFEDIFSVESFKGAYEEGPTEDEGIQFYGKRLSINLEKVPANAKSLQYWYEDNGSLKFVFGVNITEEDREKNKIYVYASLITKRDSKVYDENNIVVGNVLNYLDKNNLNIYGNNQYYDEEDI